MNSKYNGFQCRNCNKIHTINCSKYFLSNCKLEGVDQCNGLIIELGNVFPGFCGLRKMKNIYFYDIYITKVILISVVWL